MSVQQLFFNDSSDPNVILNLYNGDCPARFQAFATACSDIFGDSGDEVGNIIVIDM